MARVVAEIGRPALVIAHNKTLAAQLCNEFRELLPGAAVEYFVSYYDYYQPEAYIAATDTYIEKDSSMNDEIDRLRHAATAALLARRDVVIVASVSCIFGLGSAEVYRERVILLRVGEESPREVLYRRLVETQYQRNDTVLERGRFRVRGDTIEMQPADSETAYRVSMFGDEVESITEYDPLTGEVYADLQHLAIYPATHYVTPPSNDRPGGARDPRRARAAGRPVRVGRQAGRGPPAAPAHRVRHGDDARAGLLLGGRELLAHPRRAPRRASRRTRCSTSSPTTSSASSTSRTTRWASCAACTRATARASSR